MIGEIDCFVKASLTTLADELAGKSWTGRREREMVSLFCFGHLVRHCRPGNFLADPAQIAIEVAVPQVSAQQALSGSDASKLQVCKDIVIWPQPRMTCWDPDGNPTIRPSSIIEWKHGQKDTEVSDDNVRWLCEFSAKSDDFVGYALCSNWPGRGARLSCTRVFRGDAQPRWLHIA